jgi:hypothetical protein
LNGLGLNILCILSGTLSWGTYFCNGVAVASSRSSSDTW